MRIPLVYLVSAALLLASSCSGEKPATPAATAPAPAATPAAPAAAPATTPKEVVFGVEELDQMVAPIALYPDPLLAQVLMAATYPGDVAEAATWSKANPDAKGDAAVLQVASQPWDPSVQSLVAFPQALVTLGQDPVWVQRLGDAFLAQPDDVMDAIQRLRRKAQTAGNLESNQYQNVTVQPAAAAPAPAVGGVESMPAPVSETIIIESADPQTVYVPSYDPNVAYGSWDYPSYPPTYYPPSPYYYPMGGALATGLMWGTGLAIAGSLWGDLDWGNNDIDIDVDRYNSINSNRQIDRSQNNFQHNAANRDGVPYRDRANREANNRRLEGADRRNEFRGEDANRARSREQARASMEKRGVDAPARSNQEARDRAQAASRDRAQTTSRDQQRERAQATTRDRAQTASRDQARDRAQASQRQQASRDQARGTQGRQQEATRHRQSQGNTQARSAARNQHQSRQAPRNDAFQGASRPQQSRQSAQRGQQSHASAQRGGSRGGGQQAQRQSRQPQQRQSGRRG